MKIKLERTNENFEFSTWIEGGDIEVEVPDAIVADWRETRERLAEIEEYFYERVQPQIDAEQARRREEWRRKHPEEAKRQDAIIKMWTRPVFDDRIIYGSKKDG